MLEHLANCHGEHAALAAALAAICGIPFIGPRLRAGAGRVRALFGRLRGGR